MDNLDKGLLQKSQIHSDNLLKIVKNLKSEKQQLLQQIQQLQQQIESQKQNDQVQELELSNHNLQKENVQLANQFNQVVQELEIMRMLQSNRNNIKNTSFQSPQRTPCQEAGNNSNDRKRFELGVENKRLLQENKVLNEENQNLKKQNEQLLKDLIQTEELYVKLKNKQQNLNATINSMEQSQQLAAQNDYSRSTINLASIQQKVWLIQEFYIVSIPNTSIQYDNSEPLVLFKHPIQSQDELKTMISVLPMFCFPKGIKCVQSKQTKNDIVKILQEDTQYEFRIQVFTPNKDSGGEINNQFIKSSNPDQVLYAIILYSQDFIADKKLTNSVDLVKQKKMGNPGQNICITSIAYVILTYYPFQLLYYKILQNIVKTLKFERLQYCKQVFEQDKDLRDIDLYYFINQETTLRKHLEELSNMDCSNTSIKLFDHSIFEYNGNKNPKLIIIFEQAPNDLLQNWTAQQFTQVFEAVILEQKVAIIGKKQKYISFLMILFSLCIKPLKYYHPFILDVPEKLQPLLDAPVPVFLGFSDLNSLPEITEVLIVNIGNQNITLKNLETLNSNLLIELENQLKPVFSNTFPSIQNQVEFLLQIISPFVRQCLYRIEGNQFQDLFLQRIKETQIYQMKK